MPENWTHVLPTYSLPPVKEQSSDTSNQKSSLHFQSVLFIKGWTKIRLITQRQTSQQGWKFPAKLRVVFNQTSTGRIRNISKHPTVYKPSVVVLLKLRGCQGMTERAIPYSNSPSIIMVLEYSNDLNPGLMQPVELPEKALPIVLIYKTNHVLENEIKLSYLLYGPP